MNPLTWLSQNLASFFASGNIPEIQEDSHPLNSKTNGRKRPRAPQNSAQPQKKRKLGSENDAEISDEEWARMVQDRVVCLTSSCDICPQVCSSEQEALKLIHSLDASFEEEKQSLCSKKRSHLKYRLSRLQSGSIERFKLSAEGVYSITPEAIAKVHARRCLRVKKEGKKCKVWDVFAGWGGNVQELLRYDCEVIASEIRAEHLFSAHFNVHAAKGYDHESVAWIHLDALTLLRLHRHWKHHEDSADSWIPQHSLPLEESMQPDFIEQVERVMHELDSVDAIFLCPPWGGPEVHDKGDAIDLRSAMPLDTVDLFAAAYSVCPNVMMMMPRNSNTDQVAEMLDLTGNKTQPCEIQENYFDNRLLSLTFYFGDLVVGPRRKPKKQNKGKKVKDAKMQKCCAGLSK